MNVKGNNELVFNPKDFKCLIRKYMGNEAAVYFGEIVDYANKAVRDAKSADKEKEQAEKYVKNAICLNAISFLYLKKEIMI